MGTGNGEGNGDDEHYERAVDDAGATGRLKDGRAEERDATNKVPRAMSQGRRSNHGEDLRCTQSEGGRDKDSEQRTE
jgi:hypothetical protein